MKLLICTQVVDRNHPILGFFHSWIEEFAAHSEKVHVICLEQGDFDLPSNVHVYSLGKETGASKWRQLITFYRVFGRLFFKVRVQYVFFHMGAIYNFLAAPFFFLRGWYHTKFYWWKTHGQINFTGRLALFFVDRVYTAIEASFPINSQKRRVVGHAIDTQLFINKANHNKTIDILYAGRFSRSKHIEQVVEAVSQLTEKKSLKVILVGQPTDPIYVSEIRSLIKKYDLDQVIKIHPPVTQDELVTLYQSSKVFMNPSEHDGLDKVILEAMAAGTIPVTGNASFDKMLSAEDLFVIKGDITGFVNVINRVLHMPTTEYSAISSRLRATVVKNHSIDTLTARLFNYD